ncbi:MULTISPECIES: SapB/AmfS family lanthipeptide [unclassified Streptomyces]
MNLLDLQSMEISQEEGVGETATASQASLLLCFGSALSVITC